MIYRAFSIQSLVFLKYEHLSPIMKCSVSLNSDPDDVIVVVGEHDLTVTESTQKECEVMLIIVHPEYDSWELM